MKRIVSLIITFALFALAFTLTACSSDDSGIQGVSVTDSGEAAVTFRVPNNLTVEGVLGSEIGEENTFYVTGSSNQGFYVYWYKVESGGILSRNGNIYRYGPEAAVSNTTGVSAPPGWVMIYSTPSEDEIFNSEDTELLKEKYGIKLYFN